LNGLCKETYSEKTINLSMFVREITCKSILSPCRIPGFTYLINPYHGCALGCIYCYARGFTSHSEKWGEFVDVKINAPYILRKEIKGKKKGRIMFSSVTDPYQPLEKKYEITRKILEILAKHEFPVSLLTKCSLIERDPDLITGMKDSEFGSTITCLEADRKFFEPRASPVTERLIILKKMSEAGIKTFVFLGPFLPGISDKNLEELFEKIAEANADYVLIGRLRIKCGNWFEIKPVLEKYYPELLNRWIDIFFKKKEKYYENIKTKIMKTAGEKNVKTEFV